MELRGCLEAKAVPLHSTEGQASDWGSIDLDPQGNVLLEASGRSRVLRLPYAREAADKAPVTRPADVARKLGEIGPGRLIRLDVTQRSGAPATIAAAAAGPLDDVSSGEVRFLLERRSSPTGWAFEVGPLGGEVVHYRDAIEVGPSIDGNPGYCRAVAWGALLDLVKYQSSTDLGTGSKESKLRLLWVIPLTLHSEGGKER